MDGYEVIDKLNNIVNYHHESKSSIHQSGYKDDIFKLFLQAHRGKYFEPSARPRLAGDATRNIFFQRHYTLQNRQEEEKLTILNAILNMWDGWYYALNKVGIEI